MTYIVVMAQSTLADLMEQAGRLGLRRIAGPEEGAAITRVEIAEIDALDALPPGTLAVIALTEAPSPFRVDIAIRQASARGIGALVFIGELTLASTAIDLAERGGMPMLVASGVKPSELAVSIDRIISGGASETMTRAAYAIDQVRRAAAENGDRPMDAILDAASDALGVTISVADDAEIAWNDSEGIFIGEVGVGRLVADAVDSATSVALPVIASILSRSMYREVRDRFAPKQSRADLIVQLVLAESSRVEEFSGQAARVGLPIQLSHVVGWLKPTHRTDPAQHLPHALQPAVEFFALQLVDDRDEMWHIAFMQDDAVIISTEESGAGDHQRRLREVAATVAAHARTVAGPDWDFTLGLGTPQAGAA